MRIGAVFPQTEIGANAPAILDYARAVEEMGYTHILAYDHVLDITMLADMRCMGYDISSRASHVRVVPDRSSGLDRLAEEFARQFLAELLRENGEPPEVYQHLALVCG